jgi:hypothetical protein
VASVETQPDGRENQQPAERRRSRDRDREPEHRGANASQHRLSGVREPARATPYLYSAQEIAALMAATVILRGRLRQATYRTLIRAAVGQRHARSARRSGWTATTSISRMAC